jgi:hypothetical protein
MNPHYTPKGYRVVKDVCRPVAVCGVQRPRRPVDTSRTAGSVFGLQCALNWYVELAGPSGCGRLLSAWPIDGYLGAMSAFGEG